MAILILWILIKLNAPTILYVLWGVLMIAKFIRFMFNLD